MVDIDLKILLEAGAHFGHQTRRWNPKMGKYLYGDESGVHIFDLIKTKEALEEALSEVKKAKSEGKTFMFVGTKKQAKEKIAEVAKSTGSLFVNERWLGGTLTNFEQMVKTLKKLEEMKIQKSSGGFNKFTKKERLMIDRQMERIERFFGGVTGMSQIPDYLIVVDVKKENGAIKEAIKEGVKTIAIVDSNSDPDDVDFVIPMNDDATKAVTYVLDLFGKALNEPMAKKIKVDTKKKSVKSKKNDKN